MIDVAEVVAVAVAAAAVVVASPILFFFFFLPLHDIFLLVPRLCCCVCAVAFSSLSLSPSCAKEDGNGHATKALREESVENAAMKFLVSIFRRVLIQQGKKILL